MKRNTEYTCGPASFRMWLTLNNKPDINEEILVDAFHTTEQYGTLPRDFIAGLENMQVKCELLSTLEYKSGDIALIQESGYGHWIVILESGDAITYYDPYDGTIKVVESLLTTAIAGEEWFTDLVIRTYA